jgi:hypothetical protein
LNAVQTAPSSHFIPALKRQGFHVSRYILCKALGYLGGALKLTPNTDTILAESARAASDYVREKTLQQLGIEISKALG